MAGLPTELNCYRANWTFPTSNDHLSACPTSTDLQKSGGWTNPFEKYSSFHGNLPEVEVNIYKQIKPPPCRFAKKKWWFFPWPKIQEPPNPRFSCSGQLFCLLLFLLRVRNGAQLPSRTCEIPVKPPQVKIKINVYLNIEPKTRLTLQIIHPLPKNLTWNYCNHTVYAKNPAPVEVGSLSHYLQGFVHPNGGWEWDFWTIMPIGSNWANCHKINQLTGTYRAASWKNLAAKVRLLHPPVGVVFQGDVFFHEIEMLGKSNCFQILTPKTFDSFIILWFLRLRSPLNSINISFSDMFQRCQSIS